MRRLSFLILVCAGAFVHAQQPVEIRPLPKPPMTNAPTSNDGKTVLKDLAYGDHERQKLDLSIPKGDGPFPLILWVHGGGWEAGSKEGGNPAKGMLERGFAVASTNYRLSQHAQYPAQIHDVKGAVKYLRANAKKYKLNPDLIGVVGGSAGGHLVALLGTTGNNKDLEGNVGPKDVSSKVACVLDFFGPTDLHALSRGVSIAPITKLLGGTTKEKPELAKLANPINFIDKNTPPFLIVHGDKDTVVAVSQSELLNDALKKASIDTTLIVVPGAGHGNGIFTPELMGKYADFFEKHLKPKK